MIARLVDLLAWPRLRPPSRVRPEPGFTAPALQDCLVDVAHGPMAMGGDGREFCETCGYVPCACDGA